MLGLGSLGILWVMGPGAGVGRKEQDKGCEGGEGSGGSRARGERPAALCSLALPTTSLSSASRGRSASGVFSAPQRGCSPHGANRVLPQPTTLWRVFLMSRDVPGLLEESLAGGFPVWHLLSPRCKTPGVATPLPRGPRMGSS